MSHLQNIKKLFRSQQNPYPLYIGTFCFSGAHGGVFTVALPFVITLIGGTDRHLGLCSGLSVIAYLISCIAAGKFLDNFSPKRALQISSATVTVIAACIFATAVLYQKGQFPLEPIITVAALMIALGLSLALFWPPMMGWLSTGHEGPALSRKLGIFNTSWSLALVVSPIIGGYLAGISPTAALLLATVMFLAAFTAVTVAPTPPKADTPTVAVKVDQQTAIIHPANTVFCWMSRLALITTCIAVGLMRTQAALLFTDDLGFTKFQFGILTMFLCLACFAIFYITGKTHRWHHRLLPFFMAQIIVMIAMVLILTSHTSIPFYIAAALIGLGQGFVYSSHQYYGVSGSKKRSGNMAIHEIVICIGYGSGAIAGGYIAEYYNRLAPYKFGICILAAFIVIQLIMFLLIPRRADT